MVIEATDFFVSQIYNDFSKNSIPEQLKTHAHELIVEIEAKFKSNISDKKLIRLFYQRRGLLHAKFHSAVENYLLGFINIQKLKAEVLSNKDSGMVRSFFTILIGDHQPAIQKPTKSILSESTPDQTDHFHFFDNLEPQEHASVKGKEKVSSSSYDGDLPTGIAELRSIIRKERKKTEKLEEDVEFYKQKLQTAYSGHTSELEALNRQIKDQESKIQQFKIDIATKIAEIKIANDHSVTLQDRLDVLYKGDKTQQNLLKDKDTSLLVEQEKISRLEIQIEKMQEEINMKERQANGYKDVVSKEEEILRNELNATNEELKKTELKIKNMTKGAELVQKHQEDMIERLNKIIGENGVVESELKIKLKMCDEQISEQKKELERVTKNFDDVTHKYNVLLDSAKISEEDRVNSELNATIERLQGELQDTQKNLSELKIEHEEDLRIMQRHQREIENLQETNRGKTQTIDDLNSELTNLKSSVSDVEPKENSANTSFQSDAIESHDLDLSSHDGRGRLSISSQSSSTSESKNPIKVDSKLINPMAPRTSSMTKINNNGFVSYGNSKIEYFETITSLEIAQNILSNLDNADITNIIPGFSANVSEKGNIQSLKLYYFFFLITQSFIFILKQKEEANYNISSATLSALTKYNDIRKSLYQNDGDPFSGKRNKWGSNITSRKDAIILLINAAKEVYKKLVPHESSTPNKYSNPNSHHISHESNDNNDNSSSSDDDTSSESEEYDDDEVNEQFHFDPTINAIIVRCPSAIKHLISNIQQGHNVMGLVEEIKNARSQGRKGFEFSHELMDLLDPDNTQSQLHECMRDDEAIKQALYHLIR